MRAAAKLSAGSFIGFQRAAKQLHVPLVAVDRRQLGGDRLERAPRGDDVERALLPDEIVIQVDGGVSDDNIRQLRDRGAELFVAASAIFGREDLPRAYRRLVQALA